MARKKTDVSKPSAAELATHAFIAPPQRPAPTAPPLNSPEFDQLAKDWLEELIRRAKAKGRTARRPSTQAPPSLTIRARSEGSSSFDLTITNVYDLENDPLDLMVGLKEVSRDALEDAIFDAGYNGWVAPPGPGMKGPFSTVFDLRKGVSAAVPRIPNVSDVIQ